MLTQLNEQKAEEENDQKVRRSKKESIGIDIGTSIILGEKETGARGEGIEDEEKSPLILKK